MTFRRLQSADGERAAAVSRREFLTLRTSGSKRVLELACEPLYMRYVDARSMVGVRGGGDATGPAGVAAFGEPPTEIELPTEQALFAELERKLFDADVVRVTGREWLPRDEFGRRVESYLEAFGARGGRLEYRNSA